jgi:hypothetical protein
MNSLKKIELGPSIYAYPNFLTKEEIDFIYNRAINASQKEWDEQYEIEMKRTAEEQGYVTKEDQEYFFNNINKRNDFWKDKMLKINNTEMCLGINDRFYDIWKAKDYKIGFPEKIQRQYVGGDALKVHYDAIHNKEVLEAVVVYINDNYEGGELFFPQHNIEIKPTAGTMITFPGTSDYEHGTKVVTSGSDRFVIAVFVFKRED